MPLLNEHLVPFANELTRAGFLVHVPTSRHPRDPVGHTYVSHPDLPSVALVQIPTFPGFEPISLSVPVAPSREHGSEVPVDYDGTPESAVEVLREVLKSKTVLTRFVRNPRHVPIENRIPANSEVYVS